jgi:hypothetical protein
MPLFKVLLSFTFRFKALAAILEGVFSQGFGNVKRLEPI